jgi:pilus assembly protein Flp/PilA
MLQHFRNRKGATAIEYGLIAGLVAVALIVGLTALGTSLDGLFTDVATTVDGTY